MTRFSKRGHVASEIDGFANAQSFCISDECLPAAKIDPLVQSGSNFGITPLTLQLCWNDSGIVKHQTIAIAEQRRQIPHLPVGKRAVACYTEHPGCIAWYDGAQRDPLGGKVKIE